MMMILVTKKDNSVRILVNACLTCLILLRIKEEVSKLQTTVLLLAQLDVGLDSFCLEIHKIDLFGALHIAELQNK